MVDPKNILRRRALEYHQREDRGASCGSMAIDMDLMFSGLVEIGKDGRLYVTEAGRAVLAKADRSPKGGNRETGYRRRREPGPRSGCAQN